MMRDWVEDLGSELSRESIVGSGGWTVASAIGFLRTYYDYLVVPPITKYVVSNSLGVVFKTMLSDRFREFARMKVESKARENQGALSEEVTKALALMDDSEAARLLERVSDYSVDVQRSERILLEPRLPGRLEEDNGLWFMRVFESTEEFLGWIVKTYGPREKAYAFLKRTGRTGFCYECGRRLPSEESLV